MAVEENETEEQPSAAGRSGAQSGNVPFPSFNAELAKRCLLFLLPTKALGNEGYVVLSKG